MKLSQQSLALVRGYQKCIDCRACMKGSPLLQRFCASPKKLLQELLETGEAPIDLPFSCMQCGYCRKVCPVGVDFEPLFLEMRRDALKETRGMLPKVYGEGGVRLHQMLSFSPLFIRRVKDLTSDTIFFPGCALLSSSPELVRLAYRHLHKTVPGIGYSTACCGKPTYAMGEEDRFRACYQPLKESFEKAGVKRVITACQNCFKLIGRENPELEVVSLWTFLQEHGIPKERLGIAKGRAMTLHDPCPIRDEAAIHDAVRAILKDLGVSVQEMPFTRDKTLCCGSGGMVGATRPELALAHRVRRAEQADADEVVTYCQECVESLRKGGKQAGHLLELIFGDPARAMNEDTLSLAARWGNRLRAKTLSD